MHNKWPSCFCAPRPARRTAKSTAIGALSRTGVSRMGGCCNAMCCIWGRSTPRRSWRGVNRLKYSKTAQRHRARSRYSPKIDVKGWCRMKRWCGCGSLSCGCAGPGNGVRVGWRFGCGKSCGWMSSGPSGSCRAARARAGIRSCSCSWPIDCSRRAASGGSIGSGMSAAPWRICSVPMRRSAIFTRSIGVTTGCSSTSARCSIT